jgi:hypothetical protein
LRYLGFSYDWESAIRLNTACVGEVRETKGKERL